MGDWNGDKAKNDLLKEKNFKTLAKSVCLLLEDGWEERKKGALKYPVMNLKDGKWVYNAEGLSSARAYGEQHDPSVAEKAISIQKRLGLYKEDKEDNMEEEKKLSESESKDTEKDIVMEEPKEEETKEMAQEDNKEEQPKEMGCDGETKEMSDDDSKDDDKDDEQEDKEDDDDKEKKFSLDAYVDQVAMLAMLENETEDNKKLADEVMKQMSANEIVEKFVQMAKENAELKIEKEKSDKEKRDKKFSAIMASVKEDLDAKLFSELSEEGKDLTLEQLGAFENKVKAFAYEATKNKTRKEDDGIMRFAGVDNSQNNQDSQDVFDRLSKM